MVHLFLSEPDWSRDEGDDDFVKQRVSLLNDLNSIVRSLIASESRSEARLWLCKDLSGISSLSRRQKRDLFVTLLRTSSQKKDLAAQLLQMIFDKQPKKAGSILAKKRDMLEDFFRGTLLLLPYYRTYTEQVATATMAKAMFTRPHITVLCAYSTHLFRCHNLRPFHSQPLARLILPVKNLGRQQLIIPKIHMVGRRSLSTRVSSPSNGPGPIDSPLMQSMENKIKEQLNADLVTVNDAYGDGRHVSIDVVSSAFEGQSAVNRQRMVYKAMHI